MHIGIIPDGNRRYMEKKGIMELEKSYRAGINKFYDFLDWCISLEVDEVTVYALSLENIKNRSDGETGLLFRLFAEHAEDMSTSKRLHDSKVRVVVSGDIDAIRNMKDKRLAERVISDLRKLEESTKGYKKATVNFAIAYGGRQEIINAAKKVVAERLPLTEENLQKNLWVKNDPDLIIRTSESRLSNFMVWQSAYSELYFVDKLWQEFELGDLNKIMDDYKLRDRRFGK
ncbi:MAG: di-trans,poly-cis-decaprenylcistransferase [Candidatus Altiarchaeales archaeon IMC4]|nr:MAG: di-trans,poly-cis-decaprenylcistransferase [Candidatus Altiarchaeales archaeon IMC4]